ncbi:hypothetical protein LTR56_002446 [Elasticomyces elasticus]|nr:hypothetical protein LTR22_012151 [Elasticomyces elasticus]KAK3657306.1 hypothetical protein LTR56_002446 [Elasticomyces elasticus]KAK4933613.1 hypothetical protein LTR49_000077 [Elasticomyces elasticus]KAK5753746.1 hypothetical protein LTS12_016161 [Elasticomyces elasticus]
MSSSMKEKEALDIEASPDRNNSEPIVGEIKDVRNADVALDFLRSQGDVRPMTPEDEKRLVRKIDWMMYV